MTPAQAALLAEPPPPGSSRHKTVASAAREYGVVQSHAYHGHAGTTPAQTEQHWHSHRMPPSGTTYSSPKTIVAGSRSSHHSGGSRTATAREFAYYTPPQALERSYAVPSSYSQPRADQSMSTIRYTSTTAPSETTRNSRSKTYRAKSQDLLDLPVKIAHMGIEPRIVSASPPASPRFYEESYRDSGSSPTSYMALLHADTDVMNFGVGHGALVRDGSPLTNSSGSEISLADMDHISDMSDDLGYASSPGRYFDDELTSSGSDDYFGSSELDYEMFPERYAGERQYYTNA